MWGVPYRRYPGYWAWGFDPSKKRFGGTTVEYAGAYAQTLNHLRLWEHKAIKLGFKGYNALKKTPASGLMKKLKGRLID